MFDLPPERPKEHTYVKAIPPVDDLVQTKVEAVLGWIKGCHAVERKKLQDKINRLETQNKELEARIKDLEANGSGGKLERCKNLVEKARSILLAAATDGVVGDYEEDY